jgi:hypothetical protein
MSVVTPAPQAPYAAGQSPAWFAQSRGTASVLHVDACAVQFVHAAPPDPHAAFEKPTPHTLPAPQQPAQFAGPHFARHTRPWQAWFAAPQSEHAAPPCPHALSATPVTHVLPEQQPPGQFAGPQAGFWQEPP